MSKKTDGEQKKKTRGKVRERLVSLNGKAVDKLSKLEQENLLIAMGQMIGIIDDMGVIRL